MNILRGGQLSALIWIKSADGEIASSDGSVEFDPTHAGDSYAEGERGRPASCAHQPAFRKKWSIRAAIPAPERSAAIVSINRPCGSIR